MSRQRRGEGGKGRTYQSTNTPPPGSPPPPHGGHEKKGGCPLLIIYFIGGVYGIYEGIKALL